MTVKLESKVVPYLMWWSALIFFAFQFILRLSPGLVMPQLVEKFQIQASDYGLLSSMYYIGYAGAQIPIAILLDKYGTKKVVPICVLICAIANFGFVHAESWEIAMFSRFLIGLASAVGFLGTSKVISTVFPAEAYAKMVGYSFTVGLLGAVYGGKPVASMMMKWGWVRVLDGATFVCLFLSICLAVVFRRIPKSKGVDSKIRISDLRHVLRHPALVILAVCNLLMVGPLEGFADVWSISYFTKVFSIQKNEAAGIASMIFVGMLVGGPLLAYVSDRCRGYFKVTALCGAFMSLIFSAMLVLGNSIPMSALYVLMFMVGILCCYQVLIFAMGTKMVDIAYSSMAVAFLNCVNMLGGSFFHSTIGFLLDFLWSGNIENGVRFYPAKDVSLALWVIPVASVLGAAGVLLIERRAIPDEIGNNL
jgi:predicted MFS family arabinose efflux permease